MVARVSIPRIIPAGHRERVAARVLARRLFSPPLADGLFEWMRIPGVQTAVAVDPQVVGFVTFDADQIQGLGVDPARRGEGLGRRLIEHALEPARPLLIHVGEDNAPAQALYRSVGFVPDGESGTYEDGTRYITMFRHAHPEPS